MLTETRYAKGAISSSLKRRASSEMTSIRKMKKAQPESHHPLGLFSHLPLELRQQIYGELQYWDEDDDALHLGILPTDDEENNYGLIKAHPILAEEIFDYSGRLAEGRFGGELGCKFHASQFEIPPIIWTAAPGECLDRIQRVDIRINYSAKSDISSRKCMSQLKIIRSNVSYIVDIVQRSGPIFDEASYLWGHEYWTTAAHESGLSTNPGTMGRLSYLPGDDIDMIPFVNYVVAPLARLGKRSIKAECDHGEEFHCLSTIHKLNIVYLELKITLRKKTSEEHAK